MIQNSNLRFSYQEKQQFLSNQPSSGSGRPEVGRLVSNYQRNKAADEEEEQLITKKSGVLNNDSFKNSKIYSDARFSRVEKISGRRSSQRQKYSFNQDLADNESRQQKIHSSGVLEPIKQLPLIMRNSREVRHSQTPKLISNESLFEISALNNLNVHPPKGRSFSISSYDIYKPGFLANRQEQAASQKKEFSRQQKPYQSDSSFIKSYGGGLSEEKPQPALQINFENSTDRDLPQFKENESSISNSNLYLQNREPEQSQSRLESKNIERLEYSRDNPIKKKQSLVFEKGKNGILKDKQAQNQYFAEKNQKEPTKQSVFQLNRNPPDTPEVAIRQNKSKTVEPEIVQKNNVQKQEAIQYLKQDDRKVLEKAPKEEKKSFFQQFQQKQPQIVQQKGLSIPLHIVEGLKLKEKEEIAKIEQPSSGQTAKNIEESYRPYDVYQFSSDDYMKVYQILKEVHTSLKAPVLDSHALLKNIKTYLQIIAGGSLDHVQGYTMPLHKLKIIKNALLYERIAVVIISFAYAIGKVKECLKYLINLISYASNNTLLILKILQGCEVEAEALKNPIIAKSDRLIMKRNFDTVRNSNDIILDSIFKISKMEEAFYDSFKDIIKSIGKNSLEQTFYNVLEYFSFFLCVSGLHMTIPFLSVAPNPYLRETIDKRPTLIIDIVQVFCHGTRKSKSHIFRPHTQYFLSEMSQYYEVISFTCAYPNQIDKVIDILDPKNHIKHRLYRHHALTRHNVLFKDIERLGRDVHKVILLDSQANAIEGESLNTIKIPVWRGNKNDTTLAQLCPILATIAVKDMNCLQAARKINEQQMKNELSGIKYLNFGISFE